MLDGNLQYLLFVEIEYEAIAELLDVRIDLCGLGIAEIES